MTETEWLESSDPARMLELARSNVWPGFTPSGWSGMSDRQLRLFSCACVRQVWHLLRDERSRRAVEVAERYADGEATEEEKDDAVAAIPTSPSGFVDAGAAWCLADPLQAADYMARRLLDGEPSPTRHARGAALQAALLRDVVGDPVAPVTLPRGKRLCPQCKGSGCDYKPRDLSGRPCNTCGASGRVSDGPCPWLTPAVLSLAQAAYEERPGRECVPCKGVGQRRQAKQVSGETAWMVCPDCGGAGRVEGGLLDPHRLLVLADALEEAGCDSEPLLRHLRGWRHATPEVWVRDGGSPHVRGCWAVDLLLGEG